MFRLIRIIYDDVVKPNNAAPIGADVSPKYEWLDGFIGLRGRIMSSYVYGRYVSLAARKELYGNGKTGRQTENHYSARRIGKSLGKLIFVGLVIYLMLGL